MEVRALSLPDCTTGYKTDWDGRKCVFRSEAPANLLKTLLKPALNGEKKKCLLTQVLVASFRCVFMNSGIRQDCRHLVKILQLLFKKHNNSTIPDGFNKQGLQRTVKLIYESMLFCCCFLERLGEIQTSEVSCWTTCALLNRTKLLTSPAIVMLSSFVQRTLLLHFGSFISEPSFLCFNSQK